MKGLALESEKTLFLIGDSWSSLLMETGLLHNYFGNFSTWGEKYYVKWDWTGNELSLDLHKSLNELNLDFHKTGNELSLDLHKTCTLNIKKSGILHSLIFLIVV